MQVKLIKNSRDHKAALKVVDELWDAKPGSPEADKLELLSILIEDYEKKHFPIEPPDPVEYIKFRMEQQGYSSADLAKVLGGRNRASEVLNHKRGLSLAMIKNLSKQWHIPADALLA
jgi:antitoxin component HigA of HigAB toxin-antitoxin module